MEHVGPPALMLLVAAGLFYAGLRGVRGRSFWLPGAHDGVPDIEPEPTGVLIPAPYSRRLGVVVLIAALVLGGAALRSLLAALR